VVKEKIMFKSIFLGSDLKTSVIGYIIAGLQAYDTISQTTQDYKQIALAVAIAIFGRFASDTRNT